MLSLKHKLLGLLNRASVLSEPTTVGWPGDYVLPLMIRA